MVAGRVRLTVGADHDQLVPLRDPRVKGFPGFLIAFTLDAEVVVAAVGSLDCAGNFHLTTIAGQRLRTGLRAPLKRVVAS